MHYSGCPSTARSPRPAAATVAAEASAALRGNRSGRPRAAEAVYLIETATERTHEQLRQGHLANVREATNQVLDRLRWCLRQITTGEAEPKALTALPAPCSIVATTFFRTALGRDSALHERAEPLALPPATEPT